VSRLRAFYSSSLIKNANFLLVSNAVLSGFGFLFWIVAARLFPKVDIGVATVLLSSTVLVTTVGMLGLDSSVLRFLAVAPHPQRQLQATTLVTVLTTLLGGGVYILVAPHVSHTLSFLSRRPLDDVLLLGFLVVTIASSLAQVTFTAERRAGYVTLTNTLYSVGKVALLVVFVGRGAWGIVGAGGLALLAALIVAVVVLRRRFQLTMLPIWHRGALTHVRAYASTLLLTGIENASVTAIVPLIVLAHLGAARAADYYVAMNIALVLGQIPATVFQSLLAEGAHALDSLARHVHDAARHLFSLLVPAVVVAVLGAHLVLSLFGASYARDAGPLLELLALAAPFSALNYLADAVTHVRQWNRLFFVMNSLNVGLILGLSLLLIHRGLTGLGEAWLLAQVITAALYAIILRRDLPSFLRPARAS
jgi:O-antigen/teichoic acid export membrane protein